MKNIAHGKTKGQVKMPKGSVTIEIGWLNVEVAVVFNGKQIRKLAKALRIPPDDEFCTNVGRVGGMATVAYDGHGMPFFILFLPSENRRVVIHECTHMVHMLMESRGIPIVGENTEVIAYMTDHLCEVIFRVFKTKAGNA